MPIGQIRNFVAVDDRFATAGQPTELELAELKAEGFEAVVNLGLLDPRYCLPDEAGAVTALGMSYHHIPVVFQAPTPEDFETFRMTMKALASRKVFVHCAMNFRVSCFTALLGEIDLGWTRVEGDTFVRRLWQPNEDWARFMAKIRSSARNSA